MSSARGFLVPVIFLGASARLSAESPAAESSKSGGRVVIRGSGSNVRLEREASPPVHRRWAAAARSAPVLEDIVRMAKQSVGDAVLIAYLRGHARELPKVLSQDDLAWLQAQAVSESVVSFLIRTAAIDIGITGEGREGSVAYFPAESAYLSSIDAGLPYGTGGYIFYGGSRPVLRRVFKSHRMLPRHPRMPFPPMASPPLLPRPAPMHTLVSGPIAAPRMAGRRPESN